MRLLIIILIGVIASGLTLYFTNQNQNAADDPLLNQVQNKQKNRKNLVKVKTHEEARRELTGSTKYRAIKRKEAQILAGSVETRKDPFEPLGEIISIHAKQNERLNKGKKNSKNAREVDLPPPPDSEVNTSLLPPPPPLSSGGESGLPPEPGQYITTGELPNPPEKQELSNKLKLSAVLGDKIVLALTDRSYARSNNLNSYVTLGRGDKFESVKVVDIDSEMAVIEENGKTRELKLPAIR